MFRRPGRTRLLGVQLPDCTPIHRRLTCYLEATLRLAYKIISNDVSGPRHGEPVYDVGYDALTSRLGDVKWMFSAKTASPVSLMAGPHYASSGILRTTLVCPGAEGRCGRNLNVIGNDASDRCVLEKNHHDSPVIRLGWGEEREGE